MKKIHRVSMVSLLIASLVMIISLFVPFWQILMWAPQYPEGLEMKIWLNNITGDIEIINGLNHYIGMKHIEVGMFPEFKVLPYILIAIVTFGVVTTFVGRRGMVWAYFGVLVAAGIGGLLDFYLWGYDYGHNLDPNAAIKVPGMSYQPPLIGTKELLNFVAYSAPDIGAWILTGSGILVALVLVFEYNKKKFLN